jgi:hypothetical protein
MSNLIHQYAGLLGEQLISWDIRNKEDKIWSDIYSLSGEK